MFKTPLLALALASLASCGGDSGNDDYQAALDQANAKQAEAISLAATSPCNAPQQCGVLTMSVPSGSCSTTSFRPYSLVSATAAAASAAAADEQALAAQANRLASPPTACIAIAPARISVTCVSNTCQAAPPAN